MEAFAYWGYIIIDGPYALPVGQRKTNDNVHFKCQSIEVVPPKKSSSANGLQYLLGIIVWKIKTAFSFNLQGSDGKPFICVTTVKQNNLINLIEQ